MGREHQAVVLVEPVGADPGARAHRVQQPRPDQRVIGHRGVEGDHRPGRDAGQTPVAGPGRRRHTGQLVPRGNPGRPTLASRPAGTETDTARCRQRRSPSATAGPAPPAVPGLPLDQEPGRDQGTPSPPTPRRTGRRRSPTAWSRRCRRSCTMTATRSPRLVADPGGRRDRFLRECRRPAPAARGPALAGTGRGGAVPGRGRGVLLDRRRLPSGWSLSALPPMISRAASGLRWWSLARALDVRHGRKGMIVRHLPTEPLEVSALPARHQPRRVRGRPRHTASRGEGAQPRGRRDRRAAPPAADTRFPGPSPWSARRARFRSSTSSRGAGCSSATSTCGTTASRPEGQCIGCTYFASQVQGPLAHLHARDVTLAYLCEGSLRESRPTRTSWATRHLGTRRATRAPGCWPAGFSAGSAATCVTIATASTRPMDDRPRQRGGFSVLQPAGPHSVRAPEPWEDSPDGSPKIPAGQHRWRADGRPLAQWDVTDEPAGVGRRRYALHFCAVPGPSGGQS